MVWNASWLTFTDCWFCVCLTTGSQYLYFKAEWLPHPICDITGQSTQSWGRLWGWTEVSNNLRYHMSQSESASVSGSIYFSCCTWVFTQWAKTQDACKLALPCISLSLTHLPADSKPKPTTTHWRSETASQLPSRTTGSTTAHRRHSSSSALATSCTSCSAQTTVGPAWDSSFMRVSGPHARALPYCQVELAHAVSLSHVAGGLLVPVSFHTALRNPLVDFLCEGQSASWFLIHNSKKKTQWFIIK